MNVFSFLLCMCTIPRSSIVGLHGNSMFNLLRTAGLRSKAAAPIYIPTSCVPGYQLLHALSVLTVFFILAILVWVKYLMVLICIFLMVNDVEFITSCNYWPFMYLLWRNDYSDSLPILNYLSFYYWLVRVLYLYDSSVSSEIWEIYFLPFCQLSFYFVDDIFWSTNLFLFFF